MPKQKLKPEVKCCHCANEIADPCCDLGEYLADLDPNCKTCRPQHVGAMSVLRCSIKFCECKNCHKNARANIPLIKASTITIGTVSGVASYDMHYNRINSLSGESREILERVKLGFRPNAKFILFQPGNHQPKDIDLETFLATVDKMLDQIKKKGGG